MSQTVHPEVLWAQRSNATEAEKNVIYLTIRAIDPENEKIELKPEYLKYSAKSGDKELSLDIQFFQEIDVENSKYHSSGSNVFFILRKKVAQEEFWPRLTKEKLRLHYIKTDFDKWVDEDEQEEDVKLDELNSMEGLGGIPGADGGDGAGLEQLLASMGGGAGGMPGMPGMPDMSQFASAMGGNGAGLDALSRAAANDDESSPDDDDDEEGDAAISEVKEN